MTKKEQEPQSARPDRRRLRRWFLGIVGVLLVAGGALSAYAFFYEQRIQPRTTIAGIQVGGLTQGEASALLARQEAAFSASTLTLTYQAKEWQVKPSSLSFSFEDDTALNQAYSFGRTGSMFRQIGSLVKALVTHRTVGLPANPIPPTGLAYLQTNVQKQIEQPFTETTLSLIPGDVTVVPGTTGQKLNIDQLQQDVAAAFNGGSAQIALKTIATVPTVTVAQAQSEQAFADQLLSAPWTIQANGRNITLDTKTLASWLTTQVAKDSTGRATGLTVSIDQTKLAAYVSSLAATVEVQPLNAVLTTTNGVVSVVTDGANGLQLVQDQTIAAMNAALLSHAATVNRTIQAVTATQAPAISSGNLAESGFDQLIGSATTDFSGSPVSRVTNITVGEKHLSGQVVPAGAEFSTVNALGPIDESHGYVAGLVIIGNTTVPADGGGLCQVSTTLFRAVLNAGLPVTERQGHSYQVSYYERGIGPGLDATIYDPSPDFKWKNDTGHPIYIQSYIKGTSLTFDLYGTSDGRTVSIDGPHTLATYPVTGSPIYTDTDTLPKGTTEYIDAPVEGARTTATYTVTRNGQVINKQVFNSYYQPMPAQYLVGTGTN